MTLSHGKLFVISGASAGMGAATTSALADRGHHVLAGVRKKEEIEQVTRPGVEPVLLDITNDDDVAALAARVESDGRPLQALINNAGVAGNAPVETMPLDVWRQMFEVNVFGHIRMTQALLPALRASRGRVVNISSTGGRIAMAAYGGYSATKFAVEAVSDALRREVAGQGVDVVVVQPGSVRTSMAGRGTRAAHQVLESMTQDQHARYADLMRAFLAQAEGFESGGVSAEHAGAVIADAATRRRPRTRVRIGRDAALYTRLARVVPDRALDRALAATNKRLLERAS